MTTQLEGGVSVGPHHRPGHAALVVRVMAPLVSAQQLPVMAFAAGTASIDSRRRTSADGVVAAGAVVLGAVVAPGARVVGVVGVGVDGAVVAGGVVAPGTRVGVAGVVRRGGRISITGRRSVTVRVSESLVRPSAAMARTLQATVAGQPRLRVALVALASVAPPGLAVRRKRSEAPGTGSMRHVKATLARPSLAQGSVAFGAGDNSTGTGSGAARVAPVSCATVGGTCVADTDSWPVAVRPAATGTKRKIGRAHV